MKQKTISILLALALCLSLLPTAALAAGETGTMPAYSGGSGTEDDPWQISSVRDLQTLANTINDGDAAEFDADCTDIGNYHGYYFKQTTDLDLSNIENWDPIGYSGSCYFAGHYDGGGYTISNAKSTGKNDDEGFATAGIFGWVMFGSVKNLTVDKADFQSTGQGEYSFVGGIAAVAFAASIENCAVKNSVLESKRDHNNNCAGGIAGYSAGGTFKNCASVSNKIQSMAYGGGFVGENDDDNDGVEESKYTDCYTADCSVNATTPDSQGTSFAGGFIGMIVSDIALTNCYAYKQTLSTEGTSASNAATGVFAAYSFTNGNTYTASINTTNCYYGECAVTTNVGSATEKTSEEFTDGTVAKALGDAFAQGKHYPVFTTDPADYTEVDAAIAKANALHKDNYKDCSAVEAAVNAVVRDKNITEQAKVDAMAEAIEHAIADLQYKDADYTKVDEALARANALNKNSYQDFSAVEKAIADVVRNKNITEQSEVDAMAKAIEDAIAELVPRPSSSGSSSSSSKPSYSVTAPGATENGSVTVSPKNATKGSTVTITVKPDDGYQLDKLTVTDAKGDTISVTDKGNGKYTFTMPASKVEINVTFVKEVEISPFGDVSTSAYYYEAVKWAQEKGITGGIGNGLFGPDQPCTRAQIVTFLWRAAGSPEPKTMSSFSDVSADSYYETAVLWAVENGITKGTSDTTFSPDATCSRAQIVTFLWRSQKSPAVGSLNPFTDVSANAYYTDAVLWAVEENITKGTTATMFSPDADCTRAQIVTLLYRAYIK